MASYEESLAKIYQERLSNFYRKYDESKLASVPTLLTKYKGKEEQLLRAMVQKYGPEPTPEELAGDDDEDDEEDEEEEGTTLAAGAKDGTCDAGGGGMALEKKDAIESEEESEEEAEPEGLTVLVYCGVCGLPPEYCEYGADYDKCKPWIKEHCPQLLLKSATTDADAKKKKRGGGVIKKKQVPDEKQRVVLYTETRSRKKTVTVVDGLETLGVKLKDAAKAFGRKFACASSVKDKDSGGSEIVIQGDVLYDLPDFLTAEYGVPSAKLCTKEAGKIVPLR